MVYRLFFLFLLLLLIHFRFRVHRRLAPRFAWNFDSLRDFGSVSLALLFVQDWSEGNFLAKAVTKMMGESDSANGGGVPGPWAR